MEEGIVAGGGTALVHAMDKVKAACADLAGDEKTGADIPTPLKALKDKKVRFTNVCDKENMSDMVFKLLEL